MSSIVFEELELQNENKYKLYMTAVDKALKSFEYTSEWADLISALGKLNKILLNHQKYPVIPRRMKISKRLAQCLHPALPSGVHLKALETYDIMFKTMGTNRLSQELFIYSSGLFPVLTDATINVKPLLLSIYENHFVPLGEKLVPGLNGFLSGVLPGLEVGTDYYDRTNSLLEKVCDGVSPPIFYTCLWECLLSNAAVRLPAILFVLSHFNRHIPMRDQVFLMGNDVNTLVNGLCSCFQDDRVLIQRSGLDFLLIGFPLHNTLLSAVHYQTLIKSALITLLRRDMSLNRRLYAWLLGSDVTTGSTSSVSLSKETSDNSKPVCDTMKVTETIDQYFKIYSKDLLISAIKNMLKNVTGSNPHDLRPYRILISLLDKSDIGPVILDDILFEVFRLLYLCWQNPGMRASNGSELLKSANLLFSSLEPWYLWDYVGSRFSEACHRTLQNSPADISDSDVKPVNSGDPSLMEVCNVIVFLLDSLSLEIYSETFSEYLPELFLHVIKSLKEHCDSLNQFQISASLKLGLKILSKVRSPVLVSQGNEDHEIFEPRTSSSENLGQIPADNFETRGNTSSENGLSLNPGVKIEDETDRDSAGIDPAKKEPTTMDKCLSCYKEFYVTFVCVIRLKLGETRSINSLFQSLSIKSTEMAAKDKAKSLELLLSRILRCNGSSLYSDLLTSASTAESACCNCKSRNGYCCCTLYSLKETVGLEWQDPVSHASKLLIELSTFQTSILSNSSFKNSPQTNEWESLPDWLISLIVCSCWLGNSCIPLQLVAISTLLDLAFLCRRAESYTIYSLHRGSDESTAVSSDSVPNQTMPIVFVPLLTFSQLSFIEHRTNVFQVIIHWLWLHLGNPVYEMKCAELICQLQNTLRLPDLVERCIGIDDGGVYGDACMPNQPPRYRTPAPAYPGAEESLSPMQVESDRIESFQKFVKLWHFSREIIRSTSSSRVEESMHRCMLKVLDNIYSGNCYLRLEAENWLFHSLLRGDCKRIVDPLLLILLDGKTARIGISHAKILRIQNDENHAGDVAEANTTFTVHTIHGNTVLYHAVRNIVAHSPYAAASVMGSGRESAPRSSSITPVATPTPTPSIENGGSVADEGIERPAYAESVSSFYSDSTICVDSNDVANAALIEFDFDECGDIETNDRRKYNTLPKEKSEKKGGSYSSLESSIRPLNQPLISVSSESIDNSVDTKIARTSVSDDGLSALADGCSEFVRSASYSETNIRSKAKDQVDKDRSRSTHQLSRSEESTTLYLAKAVIEDLITDIVDRVVSDKNSENAVNAEKEEEADSAISCTSGCSSVTLEYEKEAACYYDDEESLLKKSPPDVDAKQIEQPDCNSSAAHFYSHVLLYCDIYDNDRILYVVGKLRDILRVNARAFLFAASTNLVTSRTALVNLLTKHRNSVFAKGFHEGDKSAESLYKNTTYLEALITVFFYYVRSYYSNFGNVEMPVRDISGNKQVQRECIELLAHICFHLCRIVRTNDSDVVTSIRQLLNRCKVQRITLHCAWCCLLEDSFNNVHVFIKEIIAFNRAKSLLNKLSNENDQTFQCSYLRLLLSLIALENEIYRDENLAPKNDNMDESSVKYEYVFDRPIIHQSLFFNLVKKLLEPNNRRRPIHERVISFIIASLPFLKKSQSKIVVNVIRLLCCNIETCADVYVKSLDYRIKQRLPVDYMVTVMDGLTILSHYCLLDMHSISNSKTLVSKNEMNTLKTFKGLRLMYGDFPDSMFESSDHLRPSNDNVQETRELVLDNLPKIFASVSTLWNTLTTSQQKEHENEAGSLPIIKNQIFNLLNPIATHHSIPFFISVAVVWKEKMSPVDNNTAIVVPEVNRDQSVLVHLLSSLTSITPDLFINSVYRIIKPQITSSQDRGVDIEISILEVLVHYIKLISITKLTECWTLLVPLLREASNVTIQSQFLLCSAVNHFVRRLFTSPDQSFDKKCSKDLQEIVVKLVELCTQIAGACLEQTTWLRRNLAVRDNSLANTGVLSNTILFGKDTDKNSNVAPQYSVPAQLLLADVLIPLLDTVFRNQDKEKLNVLFINVMYNVTPYLKNHTKKNINNFHACSQLLASITTYNYTKKAWKKDIMDLLLDPSLFQMEVESVKHWRTIIANLVSQENATFRDLLSRVTMSQNNTLNLFSSKEQEYEQRSQLLKRLAFTLFCSDYDQFHKHMPDIQEKLAESLKLPQSTPGIQAQVFLCFRVLLLRMSPDKVTSLWPIIITEMVQVMLQMEYDLSPEIEENSIHMRIISGSDWPWLNNANNSITVHPHWLQLQLAAAKLLKLAVQLPANRLPQFQMYRWAFVGKCNQKVDTISSLSRNSLSFSFAEGGSADFIPHVIRIASLMNNKFGKVPENRFENLLPASSRVRNIQDLHAFYAALSVGDVGEVCDTCQLEHEIETDFVEQLPFAALGNQSK